MLGTLQRPQKRAQNNAPLYNEDNPFDGPHSPNPFPQQQQHLTVPTQSTQSKASLPLTAGTASPTSRSSLGYAQPTNFQAAQNTSNTTRRRRPSASEGSRGTTIPRPTSTEAVMYRVYELMGHPPTGSHAASQPSGAGRSIPPPSVPATRAPVHRATPSGISSSALLQDTSGSQTTQAPLPVTAKPSGQKKKSVNPPATQSGRSGGTENYRTGGPNPQTISVKRQVGTSSVTSRSSHVNEGKVTKLPAKTRVGRQTRLPSRYED
ncbi:hypothetical protein EMMF5_005834 [Cystobasidiomycetes sp. EMM_F5]